MHFLQYFERTLEKISDKSVIKTSTPQLDSTLSTIVKTIKWEVHHFYLDQKFAKLAFRLQIEKYYFLDPHQNKILRGIIYVIFLDLNLVFDFWTSHLIVFKKECLVHEIFFSKAQIFFWLLYLVAGILNDKIIFGFLVF